MRTALFFGRQCLHQAARQSAPFVSRASTRPFASGRASFARSHFANPRFPGRKILWSGAAGATLSPLAFAALGEDDDSGKTHEEAMLEASRKELKEQVPKAIQNSKKYRRGVYFFIDTYIVEPIATGLRFLHLVFIFVPVIISVPAIWLGTRQRDRDDERSGTLWWYGFLVRSMERAGAAFIKASVLIHLSIRKHDLTISSLVNGPPLDRTFFPLKCAKPCRHYIPTRLPIHSR
jgi:aarF domain-containing kinase